MSRLDSQPLPIGGHHMQMGGIPMQWPGGDMYYALSVAYAGLGYGYPPMMPQQQQEPQQEPLYTIHRPAGGHTPGVHLAPCEHFQG